MRATLVSEMMPHGYVPRKAFLIQNQSALLDFILSNNDRRWSIDEIEIYESPDSVSLAEAEERKKQLKARKLEPLSR